MKQEIKAACLSVLLAFVLVDVARAQEPEIRPERIQDVAITEIRTYENFAVVKFTPNVENNQNCGTNRAAENSVVIDFRANKDVKAMYAAALSAQLTRRTVGFGIFGCSLRFNKSNGGVPKVYRVDVLDFLEVNGFNNLAN